jgi:hypothetical protein
MRGTDQPGLPLSLDGEDPLSAAPRQALNVTFSAPPATGDSTSPRSAAHRQAHPGPHRPGGAVVISHGGVRQEQRGRSAGENRKCDGPAPTVTRISYAEVQRIAQSLADNTRLGVACEHFNVRRQSLHGKREAVFAGQSSRHGSEGEERPARSEGRHSHARAWGHSTGRRGHLINSQYGVAGRRIAMGLNRWNEAGPREGSGERRRSRRPCAMDRLDRLVRLLFFAA